MIAVCRFQSRTMLALFDTTDRARLQPDWHGSNKLFSIIPFNKPNSLFDASASSGPPAAARHITRRFGTCDPRGGGTISKISIGT